MVDNFEKIRSLLKFEDEDDFYFIQILKRRKDNPTMSGDVVVVKEYFIDNIEYFDKKKDSIIEYATKHRARAMIRLNRRSYKKTAMKTLVDVVNKIENNQFKNCKKSFSSAAGKFTAGKEKYWVVDIDKEEIEDGTDKLVIDEINKAQPLGDKLIAKIPSNSGYHYIVKAFDLREFKSKFPTIDIKKDNPTNLYIGF